MRKLVEIFFHTFVNNELKNRNKNKLPGSGMRSWHTRRLKCRNLCWDLCGDFGGHFSWTVENTNTRIICLIKEYCNKIK
jgi:hypothetical protein